LGTSQPVRVRPLLVAALLTVVTVLLGWPAAGALPGLCAELVAALRGGEDLGTVVTECAQVLVLLGGALLALSGSQVAVEVLLSRAQTMTADYRRGPAPRWWRGVVLAACGSALLAPVAATAASPAPVESAIAASDDFPPLTGLPLPDLPETAARSPLRPPELIVVRPGDSLWSIAARTGPPDATDAETARRVARLYADNRDRIGEDPDLIHPGTTLHGGNR